ncbi:MAG TPA: M1 family aminopeptidase [Gemmatimonadaceae bacterium]|nr:M1 family aminopeptidase [Gemmatimonadaceae bacterium]
MIASLLLVAGSLLAQSDSTGLMTPGISRELAARRATRIADVRYNLALDLVRRDTAYGRVQITFTRREAGDVILDFRGPAIVEVRANGVPAVAVENNGAHLRFPDSTALLRDGSNHIDIAFKALIAPAGAPVIRFHDATDGNDYLYTLLVPSDAHELFPCFDQPDLKARLTLTLTVPRGWTAAANGVTDHVDTAGDAAVVRFRETEPLPTYLFAFAAGPWRRFTGGPASTTLLVRASRAREVEVDSLQDQVGSALTSLAAYFGIPYPFQQFQYLLAPAFPFGGMEHPGVTMFNEDSFIFREPPTLTQRLGRRATIYHEVAHQWFGDYVTMRWFDDLWLKEGFATYMAAKMQEREGLPNPWMSFYLRNKPAAYDVDVTSGTTAILQPLENLDQAKSNYGAIVYNKAPGVLKQLDYLVGDSAFRAGVHDFLAAHPYGNATWRDLLDAIGTAAHRSLRDWGTQYILRPGMPVIEQRLDVADGRIRRLELLQRPARPLVSGRASWPIRTQVALVHAGATPVFLPVELRAETTEVAAATGLPAPDFVYANANDYAYALVLLDRTSTAWLERNIGRVDDPFLRAMLWGSLWDLVREASMSPERFLATALRELPGEHDEQISAGIVSRVRQAVDRYLSASQRDSIVPIVERRLLAGASDPARIYGIRKNQLDAYIDLATTSTALARLDAWLDSTTAAGLPLRQPTRWALVTRLVAASAHTASTRLSTEERRDTTAGAERRAFVAGAARPTAENKAHYFTRYFSDSTLNEEWVTSSLRAFNGPEQSALTFRFLVPALDTLGWIQHNRRIFFLGSWLGAFIGGQRSQDALTTVDRFLEAHPRLPRDLRQKILQNRDDLERTVRIRRRFAR